MINARVEQKSFFGNSDKVLGNVLAYIEEVKCTIESEVLKGLGFGLVFYHLHDDGGDVVVLTSNQIVKDLVSFQSRPPLILSEKLEQWNKAFNILRDWKYVEPSSISYGWKDKHSFAFSHSMAIPTMAVDDSASYQGRVVECHIFRSINPHILPFVLIDGLLAPPRGNALCVVEGAPQETLLYSSLKDKLEAEQSVKFHFVKPMLKSKKPTVLLKAFKYLQQMRYHDELFEAAIGVCLENLSDSNDKLLGAMEQALFSRPLPASEEFGSLIDEKMSRRVYRCLHDESAVRRRLAARFYFAAESHPDSHIMQELVRDSDSTIRQLVAEQLSGHNQEEPWHLVLQELLRDSCPQVRLKAVKSLARQPDEEVYSKLIYLTGDPDATVRAAAVSAFAHESASRWVERIIEMLHDPDSEVFTAAAKALRYAATESDLPSIKPIYQSLKSARELLNGTLVELEWTILALEGNISALERMEESYGAKFSRIWIAPVIRRAKEIQQARRGDLPALNGA